MSKPFIIVGMSGGVDSSVAAKILIDLGYRVEGLFMKNWEESDDVAYCTAQQDLEDAEQVCDTLEIPLHQINFSKEYWNNVFSYFLNEYKAGRTPNPDIICNKEIKFKMFLEYALKLGAEKIATGHYAKVEMKNQHFELHQGIDRHKDQSYFLYLLGQKELSHSLFPLGSLTKNKVRDIATECGFDNHTKKDSTGICFIGERRFRDFLSKYLPSQPGNIMTEDHKIIGRHQGSMYYTIGQREGLGIGGQNQFDEKPWYVSAKDVKNNTLTVVQGHDHPSLLNKELSATHLHWIYKQPSNEPYECQAKIRYRQVQQPCSILSFDIDSCRIKFDEPQRAITQGQSIVFYQNQHCLGGGIINQIGPS